MSCCIFSKNAGISHKNAYLRQYSAFTALHWQDLPDFFSIENADRLLYNAGQNILYWGDSGDQNCLDYTKTDGELQAHKEEIPMEYRELPALIRDCFHQ